MFFDLINLDKVRRGILYALWLVVVLVVQNLLLSRVRLFGVASMFMPAAVIAVGMFEGGVWGGVFGLFAGFFCDKSYHTTALFTVILPLFGFASGVLAEFFMNKRFLPYMALCLAALLITAFCQMFRLLAFTDAAVWPLIRTGLVQALWSLPPAALVYLPPRALSGRELA